MAVRPTIQEVTFDCSDAAGTASFWGNLLDRPWGFRPGLGGVVDAGAVKLYFQVVPEPKGSPKNRLHLDIEVDDLREAVDRAEALGGRRISDYHEDDDSGFVVMHDPEANEFCLVAQSDHSWLRLLTSATLAPAHVNPVATPPVLESEHFRFRLVRLQDADDLLTYHIDSAITAVPGSPDRASGPPCTTAEQMRATIASWLAEGTEHGCVDFAVVDRSSGRAIGIIEVSAHPADHHSDLRWALLRLGLPPDYEDLVRVSEIFDLADAFFDWFDVDRLVTHVPDGSSTRALAAGRAGYHGFGQGGSSSANTMAKTRD
ncbi:hypothetical protein GCM10009785_03700 [Brooklawnia cerclae]|uniref:RimJ/RimL family protein N-acetyltransferase n=1 Tax=Brooklawnia cerclae TaxID=349934 RepID=A0ABX0SCC4_9ACTN|nr:GNAT family N-acetyltransferase [Brooklawnia cerclae]NIH56038.1 RimJ/RimL family protein N-acetyltransferase [Brooklawnia cerclae]